MVVRVEAMEAIFEAEENRGDCSLVWGRRGEGRRVL